MRSLVLASAIAALAMPLAAQAPAGAAPADRPAVAGETALDRRADDVAAVLRGELAADRVFAPSFLAQVPAAQLKQIHDQMAASYGPLSGDAAVTATGAHQGNITLRFARAEARGQIVLLPDPPHLVSGLLVTGVTPVGDSAAALARDLAQLPGSASALLVPLAGGQPLLAHNAETPLALGSTFKLYVLAALQRQIAAGQRGWADVVPLTARSYPSGMMQEWPAGAPVTVQTLALMMMQISDNTATDQLIALIGRESVEAEYRRTVSDGTPTLPFLTTREMFAIKADPALRARYAAAGIEERRGLLRAMPAAGPSLKQVTGAFAGDPVAIDRIEWFASPADLGRLMQGFIGPDAAAARAVMTAGKGMGEDVAAKWGYVGFKGGSEPGVLNLTWLLQSRSGAWYLATMGWNNPAAPVDQARLTALANRMLALAD